MKTIRFALCLLISILILSVFSGCGEDDAANGPSDGKVITVTQERDMFLEIPGQLQAGSVNTVYLDLSEDEYRYLGSSLPKGGICGNGENCCLTLTPSASGVQLEFDFHCPAWECGKKYDLTINWGSFQFKCCAVMVECPNMNIPEQ